MKRKFLISSFIIMFCMIFSGVMLLVANDSDTTTKSENGISNAQPPVTFNWGKFVGAGLSMGGAAIGAGIGVGRIGSAAVGAISEKPEMTGISLVLVALAEGISILGLVIAILILNS
jgi:V/A-type H+/Na+-transporting ATPase subunit K